MQRTRCLSVFCTCLLLAACGGGGGGVNTPVSFTDQVRQAVGASSEESDPFELSGATSGAQDSDNEPAPL